MRYIWIVLLALGSCIDKKDRAHPFGNEAICDGRFTTEKFMVRHGGVQTGDTYSDYVTDSVSFRSYVGTHDDAGGYTYSCSEGAIVIQEFETSASGAVVVTSTHRLNIDSLRVQNPITHN